MKNKLFSGIFEPNIAMTVTKFSMRYQENIFLKKRYILRFRRVMQHFSFIHILYETNRKKNNKQTKPPQKQKQKTQKTRKKATKKELFPLNIYSYL